MDSRQKLIADARIMLQRLEANAASQAADVMRLLWEVDRLKIELAYRAEGRRLPAMEPMPD